jgi:hypothetical protein
LITGKEKAPTSLEALGCTPEPTVYEHDVIVLHNSVKVQLFDTAGQYNMLLFVGVTEPDCRS